jgi:lipoic acid synthetase
MPVARYVPPEEFDAWREAGEAMGFAWVEAGPLVRSSYHAGRQHRAAALRGRS